MKKTLNFALASLIVGAVFISCDDDDDYDKITEVAKLKIDSVTIAQDTMQVYAVQSIRTYSDYAANCQGFDGYNYQKDDWTRYVTTYYYKTDGTCGTVSAQATQFNFQPQQSGTYTFKFWNGTDSSNADVWIEKTVVVTE